MKDGNEGHGMNKKYEKFKLAVGTTFAFFILVAVSNGYCFRSEPLC